MFGGCETGGHVEIGGGRVVYPPSRALDGRRTIESLPDFLIPPASSMSRKSTTATGMFNIIATMIDGTALSLPYAVSKCGIGVGIFVLLFSYQVTLSSCRVIITLSRKTCCSSLSEVVGTLLGSTMRQIFSWNLALILVCILIGFMILLDDIGTDIWHFWDSDGEPPKYAILVCAAIVSLPMTTQDTLHALRHSCYCGFASLCVLLGCLIYKSVIRTLRNPELLAEIRFGPERYTDVLTALPIIKLTFLCQFNILGVYGNLKDPTDAHIDTTIRAALRIITLFYIIFSTVGYVLFVVEFKDEAVDNILTPYPVDDTLLLCGRCFLSVTLLAAIPVIMVPCRTIILNEILSWHTCCTVDRAHLTSMALHSPVPSWAKLTHYIHSHSHNELKMLGSDSESEEEDVDGISDRSGDSRTSTADSDQTWQDGEAHRGNENNAALLRHLTDDVDVGLEGLEPMWRAWRTRYADTTIIVGMQRCKGGSTDDSSGSDSAGRRMPTDLEAGGTEYGSVKMVPSRADARELATERAANPERRPLIRKDSKPGWRQDADWERGRSRNDSSPLPLAIYSSAAAKLALTLLLNCVIILVAVETPQVSIVWTLVGSTVSLFVGFVVPAISYLVFCRSKGVIWDSTQTTAWILLIYACVLFAFCSVHNFYQVLGSSPVQVGS